MLANLCLRPSNLYPSLISTILPLSAKSATAEGYAALARYVVFDQWHEKLGKVGNRYAGKSLVLIEVAGSAGAREYDG